MGGREIFSLDLSIRPLKIGIFCKSFFFYLQVRPKQEMEMKVKNYMPPFVSTIFEILRWLKMDKLKVFLVQL